MRTEVAGRLRLDFAAIERPIGMPLFMQRSRTSQISQRSDEINILSEIISLTTEYLFPQCTNHHPSTHALTQRKLLDRAAAIPGQLRTQFIEMSGAEKLKARRCVHKLRHAFAVRLSKTAQVVYALEKAQQHASAADMESFCGFRELAEDSHS